MARGIRLLLAEPLLTAHKDPAGFDVVRRRRDPLAAYFEFYCGWRLVVEARMGYARLTKVRVSADASRPARRRRAGAAPFDRRRYILLCVAAAELIGTPVTTIGLLAERIVLALAVDPDLPAFDTSNRAERMALVDAVRMLESYGTLTAVDGATDSFVETAAAKVLYRVDATLLMRLLAAPTGPSRLSAPPTDPAGQRAELLAEQRYGPAPDPAELAEGPITVQRNLALRHRVFRRLLDDPVVHRDDLTEAERSYLESLTGRRLVRDAAEQAGMVLEERAEGWMLVDVDAIATDVRFPDDGSHARIAALALLDRLTTSGPAVPEQLTVATRALLARFPAWAQAYQDTDGHQRLRDAALTVLAQFGLIRCDGVTVRATPSAARYAVIAMTEAPTHEETP
ncbi:TIGR02678 family protein [Pseudonocardia sp. EC080610-09]|uniref:TIGR02678 family protein n=1 Tax=unclassified Pseudonocardia TaxID=2619320 RepID=UPI003512A090